MGIERCTATHDNFTSLINWLPKLDIGRLKMEYYIFASSFMKQFNGLNLNQEYQLKVTMASILIPTHQSIINKQELKKKLSVNEILKTLCSFNLVSAIF